LAMTPTDRRTGLRRGRLSIFTDAVPRCVRRLSRLGRRLQGRHLLDLPAAGAARLRPVVESLTVQSMADRAAQRAQRRASRADVRRRRHAAGWSLTARGVGAARLDGPPWPLTRSEIRCVAGACLLGLRIRGTSASPAVPTALALRSIGWVGHPETARKPALARHAFFFFMPVGRRRRARRGAHLRRVDRAAQLVRVHRRAPSTPSSWPRVD